MSLQIPANNLPSPFGQIPLTKSPGGSLGADAVNGLGNAASPAAARFTTGLALAGTHAGVVNTDGAAGTYDMSNAGNQTLTIKVSEDNGGTYPNAIVVGGLVGATPAATTAAELATLLNANDNFSLFFLAVNNAGTLRFTPREISSRFKFYFTGGAATQIGGSVAAASAAGSAVAGSTQPGIQVQGIVEDALGNPVANAPIYISTDVAGTASTTSSVGMADSGTQNSDFPNRGGHSSTMLTAADGTFSFRVSDTAAEALNVQVQVGSATGQVAQALRPAATVVTFS